MEIGHLVIWDKTPVARDSVLNFDLHPRQHRRHQDHILLFVNYLTSFLTTRRQ